LLQSLYVAIAAALLVVAYCRYRAIRYDAVTELRQVQESERELAPRIVECLRRNFDLLSGSKSLITSDVLNRIDSLGLTISDRELVELAIRRISGEWVIDRNPWVFVLHRYYQCTRLGHIVGLHKEERATDASLAFSAGTTYVVAVEDWGISLEDVETYLERVYDRHLVCARRRVNACFPY